MGLDDMIRELAAGLRDVIENTDTAYLEKDPEEAFIDLACRLVFRVREKITVTPVPSAEERTRIRHADAAARIFDIFTEWMRANPEGAYVRLSASSKFQTAIRTPEGTRVFFGETAQDAAAQAAQTLSYEAVET